MTTSTAEPAVRVAPARWVTIQLAATLTGLTEKAIRRKMERGVWLQGRHWRKADGRVYINMTEYDRWVERAAE